MQLCCEQEFLPRCIDAERSSRAKGVRPSVCLSVKRVNCDKTEHESVEIFIPYQRPFSLVFREKEWLAGRPLLPKILGQPAPVG